MHSAASGPQSQWLLDNGPRQLELLFRAIVYPACRTHPHRGQ